MAPRLTSVDALKTFLRIASAETALDSILATVIEAVSDDCERFCVRSFTKTAYSNEVHPGGSDSVVLNQYPVNTAEIFQLKNYDDQTLETTIAATSEYTLDAEKGIVKLLAGLSFSRGASAIQVTYNAGYATSGSGTSLKVAVPVGLEESIKRLAKARFLNQQGSVTEDELAVAEKAAREAWSSYLRIY